MYLTFKYHQGNYSKKLNRIQVPKQYEKINNFQILKREVWKKLRSGWRQSCVPAQHVCNESKVDHKAGAKGDVDEVDIVAGEVVVPDVDLVCSSWIAIGMILLYCSVESSPRLRRAYSISTTHLAHSVARSGAWSST